MANNYTVSPDELTEGKVVLLRGKVGFSRITRLITGEDLAKSDQRRVNNGMHAIGKEHVSLTVTDPQVLPEDPANPSKEETFIAEHTFVSKKHPEIGRQYSIQSKGSVLPVIGIPDGNGQIVQDSSGRELAQGLDVTLVLRVYKAKGQDNRGIGLDQVVANEPVRYYTSTSAVSTDTLAARGIVWSGQPQAVNAADANPQGESAPIEGGADNGTVIDNEGFALPGPGGQQAAPQAQAAPAAPAAPVVTAPAPQQAPAPQAQAPVEETLEEKVARLEAQNAALSGGDSAVAAPGAQAAPGNPWTPGAQQGAGITYPA